MAELKKSKVTSVEYLKQWEGNFGIMHDHEIEFENGDKGSYASKSQDQNKFVVGDETEYEISMNGHFTKIKPVSNFQPNQSFSGGFKKDNDVQEMIVKQSSLKCAVELCVANEVNGINEILKVADAFKDWVMKKSKDNVKDSVKDKLPFEEVKSPF